MNLMEVDKKKKKIKQIKKVMAPWNLFSEVEC